MMPILCHDAGLLDHFQLMAPSTAMLLPRDIFDIRATLGDDYGFSLLADVMLDDFTHLAALRPFLPASKIPPLLMIFAQCQLACPLAITISSYIMSADRCHTSRRNVPTPPRRRKAIIGLAFRAPGLYALRNYQSTAIQAVVGLNTHSEMRRRLHATKCQHTHRRVDDDERCRAAEPRY